MPNQELCVGFSSPVLDRDPKRAWDVQSALVLRQIFQPAIILAPDGKVLPSIFEGPRLRAEASSDGMPSRSATIKEGLRFSDGTLVTASHVARSLNASPTLQRCASVEPRGDREVVFRLHFPNANFEYALTLVSCGVVLEKDGELFGTGPYRIVSWDGDSHIQLEKNPHYSGRVGCDQLSFRVYPRDETGRPNALIDVVQNQEVQLTYDIPREDQRSLRRLRTYFEPGNSTAILFFNTEHSELRKTSTRKALAYALDRIELNRSFYTNPLAFTARCLLPPSMSRRSDKIHLNLRAATELLQDSSISKLTLLLPWAPRPYLPAPDKAARVLSKQISELGITLETRRPATANEHARLLEAGEFDLALFGWISETPDPADVFEATLATSSIPGVMSSGNTCFNFSRWSSPELDEALRSLRSDGTTEKVDSILELVAAEVPLLPLSYGPVVAVHSWKLRNFVFSPLGILPNLAELELRR